MKKTNTKLLVTLALLTAAEIILSRFCSIAAWNIKIGFSFVPIAVAGFLFGPAAGAAVAALGDFVGAILFPIGAFFPGFTLTAALTGAVFGLALHKRQSTMRLLAAVSVNQLALSLFLNTLWISVLYGSPYLPLLATRALQCFVMFPVEFLLVGGMIKALSRAGKRAAA